MTLREACDRLLDAMGKRLADGEVNDFNFSEIAHESLADGYPIEMALSALKEDGLVEHKPAYGDPWIKLTPKGLHRSESSTDVSLGPQAVETTDLTYKRRRLQKLREQAAYKGVNTPPEVLMEIEDLEEQIEGRGPGGR